jgi:transketolase
MSMIEILIAVYSSVDVGRIKASAPDRDIVIVSKGHCAAATYGVMNHFGLIDQATLATYHADGSRLAGHVSHSAPFVEHSTGALGHGLAVACGCALGQRSRGFGDSRTFVIVGDGELQEGSVWEALMLARQHGLSNLVTLVDNNRISSITRTSDVIDLDPLREPFRGFDLNVEDVDGHDVAEIRGAIGAARRHPVPTVIICNTVKGKDVPFAEDQPIWHYKTLTEADLRTALAHLDELARTQ